MNNARVLYHLMKADFLERVRRDSFLITLGVIVFACFMFVPPAEADYVSLYLGDRRGLYNSAWLGLLFGLATGLLLTLFGFYLVKNAVDRDRQTGVGQIIAATSTTKVVYILGKWLSNLAVLSLILGIQTVMAVIMQWLRAEELPVDLWMLIAPIWSIGLPIMGIVAALAVFFECTSFLRGSFGSIVYFALWVTFAITVPLDGSVAPAGDVLGIRWATGDIGQQLLAEHPDVELIGDFGAAKSSLLADDPIFVWNGICWTARMLVERLAWLGAAVVIALGTAIPFDRFDTSRSRLRRPRRGFFSRFWARVGALLRGDFLRRKWIGQDGGTPTTAASLTPLSAVTTHRSRFIGMLFAELRLMLRRPGWLWYAGGIGLMIACFLTSPDVVERVLIPILWLWPTLIWAEMGVRERQHNTAQIVFSAPGPATRQLPAMWLAGVLVTAIATCGAAGYYLIHGKMEFLITWIVGVFFVPALALASGVWSRTNRVFEVFYPVWWYVGLLSRAPLLEFTGKGEIDALTFAYLAISVGLVLLAIVGRQQQVQRSPW